MSSPYANVPDQPAAPAVAAPPTAAPGVAGPVAPRTSAAVLPLTIGLGALAIVGAIVNGVFGGMFPSAAPVEDIYNLGITIDLAAVAVVAGIRVLVLFRRVRGVAKPGASVFAILAAAFAVMTLAGWLALGGAEYWGDGMDRYMSGAGGTFFLGALWVLALVFGEIAVRRGDSTLNRVLSIGALVIGVIVLIASVAAAVIYGLGLSA
ncbi:hypothetical protein BH11ACT5_BH11ACT5_13220 [soil metagenome]